MHWMSIITTFKITKTTNVPINNITDSRPVPNNEGLPPSYESLFLKNVEDEPIPSSQLEKCAIPIFQQDTVTTENTFSGRLAPTTQELADTCIHVPPQPSSSRDVNEQGLPVPAFERFQITETVPENERTWLKSIQPFLKKIWNNLDYILLVFCFFGSQIFLVLGVLGYNFCFFLFIVTFIGWCILRKLDY